MKAFLDANNKRKSNNNYSYDKKANIIDECLQSIDPKVKKLLLKTHQTKISLIL